MIYTLTVNPSLDYISKIKDFNIGEINRSYEEKIVAGGKGINVSTILNRLGMDTIALGFLAGFIGKEIERKVKENQIETDFIYLHQGNSRINMKIKSNEIETEINAGGPLISKKEIALLFDKIKEMRAGDILVLAGSIPRSLDTIFYASIIKEIQDKDMLVVVDTTDDLLLKTLKFHPFLIKPNKTEIEEIVKKELKSKEDMIEAANYLQQLGARNVLISLGSNGAILITESNQVYFEEAKQGMVINSTGAGDSMVAGFLYGYLVEKTYEAGLKWGVACGSATTFSLDLASKEKILEIKSR